MKRVGLILTAVWIIQASVFQAQQSPAPPFDVSVIQPLGELTKSFIGTEVTIEGNVVNYTPSWKETAPHSLVLKDNTGSLRVVIWPDTWNQIPFHDQLKVGAQVTARVLIAEYRGQLQGQVKKPANIVLGLVKPLPSATASVGAGPTPVIQAPPLTWQKDIPTALDLAKKQKKKILVFFANPDSENSNYVEKKILEDPRVRAAIANAWLTVKCDMRTDAELARQLQAFRAGTLGFYKSDGTPLRPHLVPRTADELLEALK